MTNQQHIGAGIDLGSNTFRLLVAGCKAGSLSKVYIKKLATVRLGRGLEECGLLHEEAIQKGLAAVQMFRDILDQYQPQSIRVCGTEALRRARNSRLFLHQAEKILHHTVYIINGEEEARLSLTGALSAYKGHHFSRPLLLVDVGGGSTEFVVAGSRRAETKLLSIPLGAVTLTEKFLAGSPDIAHLDSLLAKTFAPVRKKLKLPDAKRSVPIIGCGGTATSMAALDQELTVYNESLVHGYGLHITAIKKLWNRLIALPAEKRNTLPCLGEGRGEILPAGIRIYHKLLEELQEDRMKVSDTGLLEGILLSSLPADVV